MSLVESVLSVGGALITIIAIGFIATKLKVVKSKDVSPTNKFVFKFCLSVLIGRSIITHNVTELDFSPLWIASLMGVSLFIVSLFIFLVPSEDRFGLYLETVVPTIYISYAASGFPMFESIWPENENYVVTMMVVANDLIPGPLFLILAAIRGANGGFLQSLKQVGLRLITTPVLIAVVIGFIYSLTRLNVPTTLEVPLKYFGDGTLALALFCVGHFLATHSLLACHWLQLVYVVIARFAIGPALALFWCWMLGLSRRLTRQCVVICAQPTAVSCPILAQNAGVDEACSNTALLWTTILTVPATLAWLAILDKFFPET